MLAARVLALAVWALAAATIAGSGAAPVAAATPSPTSANAAADEAYAFARSLAADGARPAGSARERAGQRRAAARFRAAGLTVSYDRFAVPGHGRSRNVVAVRPGRTSCLRILMAHADSMPAGPGALDNASGVGLLVGLAPLVAAAPEPECETWLVATGAEERLYTGQPDHLGASALVRRLRRERRTGDVSWALSLDEVGRDARFDLYSPASRPRRTVEDAVVRAGRREGVPVRWRRDAGTGNSDHRELALAGMPAMKLGVVDHACRHRSCDRAGQLRLGAFRRVTRVVVRFAGLPSTVAAATLQDHDVPVLPAEE